MAMHLLPAYSNLVATGAQLERRIVAIQGWTFTLDGPHTLHQRQVGDWGGGGGCDGGGVLGMALRALLRLGAGKQPCST
jgi:hypothetical protein